MGRTELGGGNGDFDTDVERCAVQALFNEVMLKSRRALEVVCVCNQRICSYDLQ